VKPESGAKAPDAVKKAQSLLQMARVFAKDNPPKPSSTPKMQSTQPQILPSAEAKQLLEDLK